MNKEDLEKKLLINDTKKLSNFIKEEFLEVDKDIPSKLRSNVKTLKTIDINILNQSIAKMDCIKSDFEYHSQIMTVISVLITAVTFFLNFALGNEVEIAGFGFLVFLIIALIASISGLAFQLLRQKKRTVIAAYFKSLLVETKSSLNQPSEVTEEK